MVISLRARFRACSANRLEDLTRAFSLAQSQPIIKYLARSLLPSLPDDSIRRENQEIGIWESKKVGWSFYDEKLSQSRAATRTILLKEPGANGEKGVLLSCFEYNWLRILSGIDPFEDFDKNYTLVLSTSWSPTNYELFGLALEKISGSVFIVPCNYAEIPKLEAFHPRMRPLDFLACDWLEPEFFNPRPWAEREYDIVMVSNWAPFKRHWHFFRILRDLPSHLRIVCIGQPEAGYTLDDIRNLKDKFGVTQNIEFLESIPIETVNEIQANSKIALIFSRREGCCVAAVEGLMANAYLVMLKGCHVGPLDYIEEGRGAAVTNQDAAEKILQLLQSATPPESREWASKTISCYATIKKLNRALREAAEEEGRPWTTDLATPCWRPFPKYTSDADKARLAQAAKKLTSKYEQVFPDRWEEKSHF